jgi:hypothetical protein
LKEFEGVRNGRDENDILNMEAPLGILVQTLDSTRNTNDTIICLVKIYCPVDSTGGGPVTFQERDGQQGMEAFSAAVLGVVAGIVGRCICVGREEKEGAQSELEEIEGLHFCRSWRVRV